jgi:NAD(P)-dependent dehydrogenase (short-subunit alcohol dehydrogenase family)
MPNKILVTGSTMGIGKGILEQFHAADWDVCVTGRNSNRVNEVKHNLNQIRKNSAIGLDCDLEKKTDVEKLCELVNEKWGTIDCLVLNIGNGSGAKGLSSDFMENFHSVHENFLNTVQNFYSLLPFLERNNKGGSVVFIGSIAQRSNVNSPLTYAYSKRALNTFSKYQALRLAQSNIMVNIVNPGHILTTSGTWGKKRNESPGLFAEFVSKNIPVGRIGEVEDIAEFVLFCADRSSKNFLTGQQITIDGGTSSSH